MKGVYKLEMAKTLIFGVTPGVEPSLSKKSSVNFFGFAMSKHTL
jgi:hypothetical protein